MRARKGAIARDVVGREDWAAVESVQDRGVRRQGRVCAHLAHLWVAYTQPSAAQLLPYIVGLLPHIVQQAGVAV